MNMRNVQAAQRWATDPVSGISGAERLSGAYAPRNYKRTQAYWSERKLRRAQLAGALQPNETRTTPTATGLTLDWANGGAIAELAVGRMFVNKRKFKQYILSQDEFRRAGSNTLVREPGTRPALFDPRITNREAQTQGYGLRVRATGEDIKEADEGLGNVLEIKRRKARSKLRLELEAQFVSKVTTSGNYATGHSGAVTAWTGAGATPVADVRDAKQVIMSDCGELEGGEWVLLTGPEGEDTLVENPDIVDRWNRHPNPDRTLTPDLGAVAQALGVDRYLVCTMALGPATPTTSLPTATSNTFVWPSTNTNAALLYVNRSVRMTGTVAPGEFTSLAIVSQYGEWDNRYFGGDDVAGPEGQVEYAAVHDDWNLLTVAVDNTTNLDIMAGYLFTGIHA